MENIIENLISALLDSTETYNRKSVKEFPDIMGVEKILPVNGSVSKIIVYFPGNQTEQYIIGQDNIPDCVYDFCCSCRVIKYSHDGTRLMFHN